MLVNAANEGWSDRLWYRLRGEGSGVEQRLRRHENALVRLGYLERREFVVTNISGGHPVNVVGQAGSAAIGGIFRITRGSTTNTVIVSGVREDLPKWESLINELQAGTGRPLSADKSTTATKAEP